MTEPAAGRLPEGAKANVVEYTVSDLANAIKRALEDGFGYVRLRGEVSGYRGAHSSGHCYFALKDSKSKIEAVIWRGVFQRLKVKPEEGMEVIAQGRVTTYPGSSKYQIVIEVLEPAGLGALMVLLEERRKRLAAEGLFDAGRKKPLPFLPRVVGVVTSPTGAVIRDILHGFGERFPVRVIVWPVRVQGETSAAEVAAAIRGFDALAAGGPIPRPDILIVARGGGSLEDLWGFSEEIVVRAAAACTIPLIAAVGHETDWTLIDHAADARAPTPTKAAEWAVPKFADLAETMIKLRQRMSVAVRRVLEAHRTELKAAGRGLPRLEDLVALPRQRFDAVEQRLSRALLANTRGHVLRHARLASRLQPRLLAVRLERAAQRLDAVRRRAGQGLSGIAARRRTRLERAAARLRPQLLLDRSSRLRERLDGTAKLLTSLSYQGVLLRGFALVRDREGRMVRRAAGIIAGTQLDIEMADGRIAAEARASTPAGLAEPAVQSQPRGQPAGSPPRGPERVRRRSTGSDQGSLF